MNGKMNNKSSQQISRNYFKRTKAILRIEKVTKMKSLLEGLNADFRWQKESVK